MVLFDRLGLVGSQNFGQQSQVVVIRMQQINDALDVEKLQALGPLNEPYALLIVVSAYLAKQHLMSFQFTLLIHSFEKEASCFFEIPFEGKNPEMSS